MSMYRAIVRSLLNVNLTTTSINIIDPIMLLASKTSYLYASRALLIDSYSLRRVYFDPVK